MKKFIALILVAAMMTTAVPQNMDPVYAAMNKEASAARKNVALSDSKIKLTIGETYQLTAKGIKGSVKWKSNNKSIAIVSQKGLVKAKNPGKATINCYCRGCIAFAGEVSDKVFGKNAKVTTHKDFDKIKVGDHIRIGGYHSVIVWKKAKDSVTVVEGNYNSSVHWEREITRSELKAEGFYVDSRY